LSWAVRVRRRSSEVVKVSSLLIAIAAEGAVVSSTIVSENVEEISPALSLTWYCTSLAPSPEGRVKDLEVTKASQALQVLPPSVEKRIWSGPEVSSEAVRVSVMSSELAKASLLLIKTVPEGGTVSRTIVSEKPAMSPARSRIWYCTSFVPSPEGRVRERVEEKASQEVQVVPPSVENRTWSTPEVASEAVRVKVMSAEVV
jgi:hypothetical protein